MVMGSLMVGSALHRAFKCHSIGKHQTASRQHAFDDSSNADSSMQDEWPARHRSHAEWNAIAMHNDKR